MKAAAIVPFAAVSGTAANSAVSVGLIGAGKRGPTVSRLLMQNTAGRITALSDLYDEKIERAKQTIGVENPAVYKDYEELLASDVDAVMISTPAFLHAEHFEKAVQAGKHIYIEKPASPDVAGCKRIMRAADGADRRLNITFGFQRRYGQGLSQSQGRCLIPARSATSASPRSTSSRAKGHATFPAPSKRPSKWTTRSRSGIPGGISRAT